MTRTTKPTLVLVFASAENGVIGNCGGMPWHLPADLAHFKALTLGGTVLMGRRTFESLGQPPRPLPKRRNLVLSRRPDWQQTGIEQVTSLAEACAVCKSPELFVIGGAQLYSEALAEAQRIEWTRIQAQIQGDTVFNPDLTAFELTKETHRAADERNAFPLCFQTWQRRSPSPGGTT